MFTQGFGSDEELLSKQIGQSVSKIKDEEKAFSDIAKKFQEDAAKIAKQNKFDYYSGEEDPKKGPKIKEIDRIEGLKNEFEAEKLVERQRNELGLSTELEYRNKLLNIIHDYATKKQDSLGILSDKEKKSATDFNNTLLTQTQQNTKAIEDYYAKQVKGMVEYDKEIKRQSDEDIKLKKKQKDYFEKLDDEEEQNGKARRARIISDKEREAEKERKLKEQLHDTEKQLLESSFDIARSITNAIAEREQIRFDAKSKALDSYYENELRFIEQSGLSSTEKEKRTQKLKAETEARQKQIDRDRITALRKAASIQKAIDIASIIAKTAIAIMSDLSIPIYGELKAVATAAIGAAQLAAVIATPLPAYARGRKGGPAEWARTNEQGAELHMRPDGTAYIPNQGKDGVTFLEKDTSVIPADITKHLINSSYIKLASSGEVVTTNKMTAAMLEAYENQTDEIVRLQNILIKKQFGTNSMDMSGYRTYKSMIIKQ